MEILILTPKGETVKMSTRNGESVIDLKKRISERLFMAPDLQRILFFHGRVLNDANSLDQFAIEDKSVITLVEGLRGSGMRIMFKTPDGRVTEMEIDPIETILNLKKKIEEKFFIDQDFQILAHRCCRLDDEMKLEDYPIKDGSVINVIETLVRSSAFKIYVKMPDHVVCVEIDPRETVISLKKIIEKKILVHHDEFELMCSGELLRDHETLDDYEISDSSTIHVMFPLMSCGRTVTVQTSEGVRATVPFGEKETVLDLKKKIAERFSITPDLQVLKFQGGILDDDEKDLSSYPFCCQGVIDLTELSRQILVRTPDGGTVRLEISGTRTVRDLKKRIATKLSLTTEELNLVFQDIVLEDDRSINTLNILKDSVISVNVIKRIYFEKDGKEIIVQVGMEEKVSDIKRRICEKAESSSTDVQLCYKGGRRLEDDKTLLDYKIEDTAQIRVLFLW